MKTLSDKVIARGILRERWAPLPFSWLPDYAGFYRNAGYDVTPTQIKRALLAAGWRQDALGWGRDPRRLAPPRTPAADEAARHAFSAVLNAGPVVLNAKQWSRVKGHLLVRFGQGNTTMPRAATIRRWAGASGSAARVSGLAARGLRAVGNSAIALPFMNDDCGCS